MTRLPRQRTTLERNLRHVRERIARAARAAGRAAEEVELLPVTKSVPPAVAAELVRLGCGALAENRTGPLEEKAAALQEQGLDVRWHFVGHLQRNKVRRTLRRARVVHSVDGLALLGALARAAAEEGTRVGVYLQVELTGESAKHGFAPAALDQALARVEREHVEVLGLMAMGPLHERPGHTAEDVFRRAAEIAAALAERHRDAFPRGRCGLSMGMSADLEAAIAAGSTLVRVGGALFEGLDQEAA